MVYHFMYWKHKLLTYAIHKYCFVPLNICLGNISFSVIFAPVQSLKMKHQCLCHVIINSADPVGKGKTNIFLEIHFTVVSFVIG